LSLSGDQRGRPVRRHVQAGTVTAAKWSSSNARALDPLALGVIVLAPSWTSNIAAVSASSSAI
jgi:hypothetical protein